MATSPRREGSPLDSRREAAIVRPISRCRRSIMKAAVKRHLDRRSFFKSAGAAAAGASAFGFLSDADLEGAVQNVNRSSIPSRAQDHRPARGDGGRRADDLPDHPHRHQPGPLGLRRGARRRERDLRAHAEEPAARREPLQRRQALPQDQAVRRTTRGRPAACAASRWRSGTWRARPTACPSTRCWAASSATGCGSTPTPPSTRTHASRASG